MKAGQKEKGEPHDKAEEIFLRILDVAIDCFGRQWYLYIVIYTSFAMSS